ncbi:MAG: MATE family efflux transporter [Pirellulales bacterium]|nr:MATE family efflux transporter [Pirellulales bacterium]
MFQGIGFGLNNIIRGEGSPRVAMATMLIGALLNIALDALFILHLGMGVRGAALATVLAQMTTAAWVLAYFNSGKSHLRIRWADLRPRLSLSISICAIGSAPFAMQLAASIIITVFNRQLASYGGDLSISVFGIVHSTAMVFMMPIFGISQGAQPIIGYNYGAKKYDRVKRALLLAIVAASVVTTFGFAVVMLFPADIMRLFDDQDKRLIAQGSYAVRICFLMLPIVGFQIVGANYFQAIGKPKQAMFLSLSRQVILLLPGLVLWPRLFGLNGVWMALPVSDFGSSLLTALWLSMEIRGLGMKHHERASASKKSTIDPNAPEGDT